MSDPPQRKNFFLLRLCFVDDALGEYTGREVWHKLHRGGRRGASTRLGGCDPPQSVRHATALWAQSYAPQGGRRTKRRHEVVVVEAEEGTPPQPLRLKNPPPPPSHRSWPRSPPPPPVLDVGALAATSAIHVTDACQTLVEHWAVTGPSWCPHWPRGGRPSRGRPWQGQRRSRGTLSVPWTVAHTWPTRGGRRWRR